MYVNLSEKKPKQNKNKIADNQKRMYFYMCHISLVQKNKKNIPSRNSVKTKMSLFGFNISIFSII